MRAPALPAAVVCLILATAGCVAPAPFVEDGWGVQRRFDGRTPVLLSISEINAGTPPAVGAVANAVLKKPLSAVGAKTYRVTGPWDNPKVEVMAKPHAGSTPSQ